MADCADRLLFGYPLVHMAAEARLMAAKPAVGAFWLTRMARVTGKLCMFRDLVRKSRKRFAGNASRNGIGQVG